MFISRLALVLITLQKTFTDYNLFYLGLEMPCGTSRRAGCRFKPLPAQADACASVRDKSFIFCTLTPRFKLNENIVALALELL